MKQSPIKNMAYWKGKNATPVKQFNAQEEKEKINSTLFGSSKNPKMNDVVDPKEETRKKHGGNKPRKDDEGNIVPINPN